MVKRHHEIDFASGALVFPGGKVAPGDYAPEVLARSSGIAKLSPEQVALRVAGIREAFEECGVLLARPQGGASLLGSERARALGPVYRTALDRGEAGIGEMLVREDLELACEELVYFAHWITPETMPKRFDTHFFLARAPDSQLAEHDGTEMVESLWIRPADALTEGAAGRQIIIPPTRLNLEVLAASPDVEAAFERARSRRVVTVLPELFRDAAGRPRLRIPAEAGYGVTEFMPGTPLRPDALD